MSIGVHAEHCCVLHGCKYGEHDCPVTSGIVRQKYTCQCCFEEGIYTMEKLLDTTDTVIPPEKEAVTLSRDQLAKVIQAALRGDFVTNSRLDFDKAFEYAKNS
jgi:hypothetical protein